MSWQPIETAPKDGTYVLLVAAPWVPAVGRWYEDRECFDYVDSDTFPDEASWELYLAHVGTWPLTHWMPLPEPPRLPVDEDTK